MSLRAVPKAEAVGTQKSRCSLAQERRSLPGGPTCTGFPFGWVNGAVMGWGGVRTNVSGERRNAMGDKVGNRSQRS